MCLVKKKTSLSKEKVSISQLEYLTSSYIFIYAHGHSTTGGTCKYSLKKETTIQPSSYCSHYQVCQTTL